MKKLTKKEIKRAIATIKTATPKDINSDFFGYCARCKEVHAVSKSTLGCFPNYQK